MIWTPPERIQRFDAMAIANRKSLSEKLVDLIDQRGKPKVGNQGWLKITPQELDVLDSDRRGGTAARSGAEKLWKMIREQREEARKRKWR